MSLRSPLPDLDIPDVDFGSVVLARGRQQPDKIALIDAASDRSVTFGDLIGQIEAAAGGLVTSGLQPGDVVRSAVSTRSRTWWRRTRCGALGGSW
jgi:acyl-CoA synthetase (AMP-forming)/AMP-acid ligase II